MIREWICVLGRSAYYAGGMHIRVKGRQAARAEAPILVIAPHSTFLDAVIVYVAGFPSIIVRRESGMNPWLGSTCSFFNFLSTKKQYSLLRKEGNFLNNYCTYDVHATVRVTRAPFLKQKERDKRCKKKIVSIFFQR